MFKRIIVPLDGSRFAELALLPALQLAKARHGSLVLLHIVPFHQRSGAHLDPPMLMMELAESRRLKALHALSQLRDALAIPGMDIEIAATEGPIPQAIDDAVDLYDADSIVMASHGQIGPVRTLFGSIAHQVVRSAPCPVMVVHTPMLFQPASDHASHHRSVVVLLTEAADVEAVFEPAMTLGDVLSARLQFLVLAEPAVDEEDKVARWAAIAQSLEQRGIDATSEIRPISSVEAFVHARGPAEEHSTCFVLVSHQEPNEDHGSRHEAVGVLFHHPPEAMLVLPARSFQQ
jgi:nucleotide-binding universal stress UspA family protein